ncbi:uncharacterized protein LOC116349167 [Contarinia nasturtii]|uniref:uncharacterized protein LOC116349167 n=1 Tax=Contarinia nasturtii TaxID=265458 RepID=UPI0012D443FC|nr:uncharacterized protein LOC116349167 [Contarinia nasturtii]
MNCVAISFVLAVAIVAVYVSAAPKLSTRPPPPEVKLSYDDIMKAKFTNKEYFDQFHNKLKTFASDRKTKDAFAKTIFNRPSLKALGSASNEFKSLCGAIYKKKKEQQPQKQPDQVLAYETLVEATKEIYATYRKRLIGEDNNLAKSMLRDLFKTDPIKCVCLLATKRDGVEDAIEEIMGPFEVSREEAALRHFIIEQEDGQTSNDCFQFMRALIK